MTSPAIFLSCGGRDTALGSGAAYDEVTEATSPRAVVAIAARV